MNQLIEDLKAAADELEPGLPVEHGCPCNYCTQAIRRNNLITRLRTHAAQLAASERAGGEALAHVHQRFENTPWGESHYAELVCKNQDQLERVLALPPDTPIYLRPVQVTEAQAAQAFEAWWERAEQFSRIDGPFKAWLACARHYGLIAETGEKT